MMLENALSRDRIAAAYRLIAQHIRRTPVVEVDGADFGIADAACCLKLEMLQHSGSFKARGAFTNLLMRADSAGGGGGGFGRQSRRRRRLRREQARDPCNDLRPAHRFDRPRSTAFAATAPISLSSVSATPMRWPRARYSWPAPARFRVHAFDQDETMLGQGTIGLELDEQAPALDTLLVAVGGGGLIGGIAAWYRNRIRVIGVEPERRRRCRKRLPPAGRSTLKPAGSPRTRSLRAASASRHFRSCSDMSSGSCW